MRSRLPRSTAGRATAVALAVLALGALGQFLPWLLRAAPAVSSTPVRVPATADFAIPLAPAQRACLSAVAFDRDSADAQLVLLPIRRPGTRLRVTAAAPGYRASRVVPLDLRTTAVTTIDVPLAPPARAAVGELCVRDEGPDRVRLLGTNDPRAIRRSTVTLDGRRVPAAFTLRLLQARLRSPLARVPELVDRAAGLSPFGPWLFWALIPLLALGLPALVVGALHASLRDVGDGA